MIRRRIIKRYDFDSFFMQMDVSSLAACIVVKIVSPGNFDITYLILVIAFFITKKKIKPLFEEVI